MDRRSDPCSVAFHAMAAEQSRFARVYPAVAARADRRGAAGHRQRLVEGLAGRVVEVGAGNGRNFAHYPAAVTEVVAIEPEPTLRALAESASHSVPVRCSTGSRRTCRSPTASSTQRSSAWCSAACPTRASRSAEIRRVLRPGGELRFYEHVVPARQPKRAVFRAADATGLWPKLAAGCHLARDTAGAITAAGFQIDRCERIEFRSAALEPRLSYLLGSAHR